MEKAQQFQWIILLLTFVYILSVAAKKDNIIFIIADDMGWNDVGFHGMTQIPTPNIDALAADGVILQNYYGAPMCTPSRAALMTGKYPSRLGLQHFAIPENGPWGLPLHVPTLAEKFRNLGYVTRLVGKWHLGFFKSEYLPTSRGFQSHFGFWTGNIDYFNHTSEGGAVRDDDKNIPGEGIPVVGHALRDNLISRKDLAGEYLTDILNEKAINVISSHNVSKPLFLMLAHHAPHRGNIRAPVRAPENYTMGFEYIKEESRRNFAGALKALDQSVGEVVTALTQKGMLKNTAVIFVSDNGADVISFSTNGGSNWPLRGQKVTAWEGGVRLPALIWSPRVQNPGRVWNGLMHVSDWLPTLYRFAGEDPTDIADLDGFDLWTSISENRTSPRDEVLLISDPIWNMFAIRVGDYKLLKGAYPLEDLNGWYGQSGREENVKFLNGVSSEVGRLLSDFRGRDEDAILTNIAELKCGQKPTEARERCDLSKEICLFNIRDDPCEYTNLAKSHEQIVEQLLQRLKEHNFQSVPPLNAKRDHCADPRFHDNTWVPWRDS